MTRETRSYTILGLIGRGGQGNVYHARLQDTRGFHKDVAIKLLKDGLDDESMRRFRDEARILGLVRDRAIVSVDPPVLLGGRWALVMELADGLSTHLALVRGGPLPVTISLEIVVEVARVLDKLYRIRGPDGQPLNLLHRDIKPGNIQITHEGEVKLLDFGVARADFEARETHTVQHIGGTFGYIAPERLRGINTPACDVFSLGVTLRVLLTGEKPATMGPATLAALTPDLYHAIALAEEMRNEDPEKRPLAQEVERRARELRAGMEGLSLQGWAQEVMSKLERPMEDPLVGSVLTESFERETPLPALHGLVLRPPALALPPTPVRPIGLSPSRWQRPPRWVQGMAAMALLFWLTSMGVLAVASQQWWASVQVAPEEGPAAILPPPVPSDIPSSPVPAPVPVSVQPPVVPVVRDRDGHGGQRNHGGEPPSPLVAPPTVAKVDVSSAVPATVWVDDVKVGPTPLQGHPLTVGTHRIRLEAPGKAVEATVLVGGRRGATRFDWDGGPALGAR